MLDTKGAPNTRALHPDLRHLIRMVEGLLMKVSSQRLSNSVIALIIVAWQDAHPDARAYTE